MTREYDLNEKLHVEIKMFDNNGEETMKVTHEAVDVLRLSNLIQIFTAGRYRTDVRMTIDIVYPVCPIMFCEHGVDVKARCLECANEHAPSSDV